ncbi:hypothetical protein [Gimesia aquarii]|uniref:Uncharacterized protein n=1 Tax=Gimesia aquarii TaxID=2527964 RepID=A0A517VPB6_9PLAN|nr:hypothetical protein [Gimesia aquarii]QDT94864.1 hypothetical protein V144x_02970 [Gimesia aquarii]
MFESFQPDYLNSMFEKYSQPEVLGRIVKECSSKVVKWRWATDDMSRNEPFRAELYNTKIKWLIEGAKPKPGNLRHGLDENGKIQVIEDYWFNKTRKEKPRKSTYLIYGKNFADEIELKNSGPKINYLRRNVFKEKKLLKSFVKHNTINSITESHFYYKFGHVTKEISINWQRQKVAARTKRSYEYGQFGELEKITKHYLNEDGTICEELHPIIEYERPQKKETLSQLAKEIQSMLLEQIPETISDSSARDVYYCLLLCYCEEDFGAGWPPFLVLGSLNEQQRILNSEQEELYCLWSPDEMREKETNVELQLNDGNLKRMCALHCQQMDQIDNYESAKKVLQKVSKKLNQYDWSQHIEVTPDFIVAAIDNTGEINPYVDIKSAVPWSRFRSLKKQGLL